MQMPQEDKDEIRVVKVRDARADRPRAPYLSTINNLGLNASPGMPSLLDAVLPTSPRTPANACRWVESLLRQPPPPALARKLHQATRALSEVDTVQPKLHPQLSTKKVGRRWSVVGRKMASRRSEAGQ
jgi:hypothetical protein